MTATASEVRVTAAPADVVAEVEAATAYALAAADVLVSAAPADVVAEVEAATAYALGDADAGPELPLSLKEADAAEELGGAADPESPPPDLGPARPLTNQEIYRIIREVTVVDSGDALYAVISADAEFTTPGHPAFGARRFGLGYGLALFTQESGHLGSVLTLMRQREPDRFAEIFGPAADELIAVTTAPTAEQRLLPVGGEPLWSPAWVERFRAAGAIPAFQAAQNEQAIERQFRPMLPFALQLGLVTDRALAMAYDRVVAAGVGGGIRWLARAAGPLRTASQRAAAIRSLGFSDVAAFRASTGLPAANGTFDPLTHAALVDALRRRGEAVLPSAADLTCRLVAAAAGTARVRLSRLRDSAAFTDARYEAA